LRCRVLKNFGVASCLAGGMTQPGNQSAPWSIQNCRHSSCCRAGPGSGRVTISERAQLLRNSGDLLLRDSDLLRLEDRNFFCPQSLCPVVNSLSKDVVMLWPSTRSRKSMEPARDSPQSSAGFRICARSSSTCFLMWLMYLRPQVGPKAQSAVRVEFPHPASNLRCDKGSPPGYGSQQTIDTKKKPGDQT
jgi:hypothetical protein